MEILTLIIKQKYFDEILAGTKTEEYREIKPTTWKKYAKLRVGDNYYDRVEDMAKDPNLETEGWELNIQCPDAIRFYVGYNSDRDTAFLECTGVQPTQYVDENDEEMFFDYKGFRFPMGEIAYSLGNVLEKKVKEK